MNKHEFETITKITYIHFKYIKFVAVFVDESNWPKASLIREQKHLQSWYFEYVNDLFLIYPYIRTKIPARIKK